MIELVNRILFIDRPNTALERARAIGVLFALAYSDIDGFKPVNDTRAFVDEVVIEPKPILICGRKGALAAAAANGKMGPEALVTAFAPEWRPGQESNLRPSA